MISEPVKESPTYNKIVNEFMTGLKNLSDISMLVERYRKFLDCLKCNRGPSAIDKLISEWKTIENQCKKGKP